MDFFNPDSFGEPRLSMEHIREWATVAANSFLSDGTEPSVSLSKIAQSEELTPHQIETLAGEINKSIHQAKYASAEDKYHAADFPLADAARVIAGLQTDRGNEKIASVMPEPDLGPAAGPDPFEMFGVEPEPMSKKAQLKHELRHTHQKTALAGQKAADRAILAKYAADAAEKTFIKTARQFVLEHADAPPERLKLIGIVEHMAKSAEMLDTARPALAKLAGVLMHEGLIMPGHGKELMAYFMGKSADEKAPQSLISPGLEARIVNGKHPLYITLKTFKDRSSALELDRDRAQAVDDRLRLAGQYIRAL